MMVNVLLEELSNYDAWQMEKYGNVIAEIESTPEGELINSGLDELGRLTEWIFHHRQHNYICMESATR